MQFPRRGTGVFADTSSDDEDDVTFLNDFSLSQVLQVRLSIQIRNATWVIRVLLSLHCNVLQLRS